MNKKKKQCIIITGSPGTGKSTLAEKLTKKIYLDRIDLHDHYKEISTSYDRSKQCYDIEISKLEKLVKLKLKATQKSGIVIDSHIAHLLPKKIVSLCIVLTCSNLKTLRKRLQKRKYSKKKVEENIQTEIFQICLQESLSKKHNVIEFDTAKIKKTELLKTALKRIKQELSL